MEIISEKTYHYGGFWRRFVAMIIDGIVITILQMVILFIFTDDMGSYFSYQMNDFEDIDLFPLLQSNLLYLLLDVIYYAGMQSSSKQATIGKMCLDMKVVDLNYERISFLRGVGRYFAKILSVLTLMIGYIMAAFSSRKQALHDKLAGTLIIVES